MTTAFDSVSSFKVWFEQHVSQNGQPYTLDDDQARAVYDSHKNTLVTARAGSGKTRVIVAKVAYLVASKQARLNEIAVFMFNRTAAAEVNERIGAVEIDGVSLQDLNRGQPVRIASTFHKFALDIVKQSGENPQLISEVEHDALVKSAVRKVFAEESSSPGTTSTNQVSSHKPSPQEYRETLQLANSFIARAGQQYLGDDGLRRLCVDVEQYVTTHQDDPAFVTKVRFHRICLAVYQEYLLSLNYPRIDFNLLMARAIRILHQASSDPALSSKAIMRRISHLKYLMVDEYQDFSYLFFSIIEAARRLCPQAHLFAVGDDWQAINRFAGSDVRYFLDFAQYFPEDVINIPLNTNYRSDRKIVENANHYMLKNYDSRADKAVPFRKQRGKVKLRNPKKTPFAKDDLAEDALGDARYALALAQACGGHPRQYLEPAKLLKAVTKIVRRHHRQSIFLLHRHNFTSFPGVMLDQFRQALGVVITEQGIMPAAHFDARVRALTMHKSKGLEADVVILLELNRAQVLSGHPHATIFELFGDTLAAERADQHRLLYVAFTRAKHRLYLLSNDKKHFFY